MYALSKKTKVVGSIAVVVFLTTIVVCGGLWYFLKTRKELLSSDVALFAQHQAEIKQLSILEKEISDTEAVRARLEEIPLKESDVITFLSDLETMARQKRIEVKVKSVTEQPRANDPLFATLIVDLELRGSLDVVTQTIELFEVLPRQLSIPKVTLTKEGDGAGQWRGEITLAVTKLNAHE